MTDQKQVVEEIDAVDLFHQRLFEILSKPLEPVPEALQTKGLTPEQSTLFHFIREISDQLLIDTAIQTAQMAMDGIGATLLQIYKTGVLPGQLQSPMMQKVGEALIRLHGIEQRKQEELDLDSYS